jgi:hypothetical protein
MSRLKRIETIKETVKNRRFLSPSITIGRLLQNLSVDELKKIFKPKDFITPDLYEMTIPELKVKLKELQDLNDQVKPKSILI